MSARKVTIASSNSFCLSLEEEYLRYLSLKSTNFGCFLDELARSPSMSSTFLLFASSAPFSFSYHPQPYEPHQTVSGALTSNASSVMLCYHLWFLNSLNKFCRLQCPPLHSQNVSTRDSHVCWSFSCVYLKLTNFTYCNNHIFT